MRLIDADALEELFREVIGGIAKEPEMTGSLEHMIRASATVVQMIQDAPTVERAEIVRCKDCKYRKASRIHDYDLCMKSNEKIKGMNWFCAYGKPKEGR